MHVFFFRILKLFFITGFLLQYLGTVKSLLDAHALINAHPPNWMLKMAIFLENSQKIAASIKRPVEKKTKNDLTLMLKVSEFVA